MWGLNTKLSARSQPSRMCRCPTARSPRLDGGGRSQAASRLWRPGHEVEVTTEALDDHGVGTATLAGGDETLRLHVGGTLAGERAVGRIAHVSPHERGRVREAWADLVSLRVSSPHRVAPVCPRHGPCSGCTLMCLDYAAQLLWKRQKVAAELAHYPALAGMSIDPCVPSPATTGYRNQAKYVYGRAHETGRPVLGAFAARSHRVVDLAGCRVVEPVLDEVRQVLLEMLVARSIEPFAEKNRTGALRYVVMRANADGRVMVTLVTARHDWHEVQELAAALATACPSVASVVLNVNATSGNALFADDERGLFGQPTIEEQIGEVKVRLSSRSFAQANREVAAL